MEAVYTLMNVERGYCGTGQPPGTGAGGADGGRLPPLTRAAVLEDHDPVVGVGGGSRLAISTQMKSPTSHGNRRPWMHPWSQVKGWLGQPDPPRFVPNGW